MTAVVTRRAGMSAHAMVRQAQQALRDLGLPGQFTFAALHERIEQVRERPIFLTPYPLPALDLHGLWLSTTTADHIFYDRDASPLRRQATIGHEFGHMLFDHGEAVRVDLDKVPQILTEPLITRLRTSFEEQAEQVAEIFATVIVDRLHQWCAPPVVDDDPAMRDRISATFEGRPR